MRWALLVALAGCGSSSVVVDGEPCNDAGACPADQMCEPDGVCRRNPATTWIEFEPGPVLTVRLPGPGTLAAGDLGADGTIDVAFGFGPRVSLHLGPASGAPEYREIEFAPDDASDASDVVIEDATGDGNHDLLVGVRREFGGAVLMYANGDVDSSPSEITLPAAVLGLALARVDGDSFADLIVQTSAELVVVFAGTSGSPFDVDAERVSTALIDPGPFIGLAFAGSEFFASGPPGEVNVVAHEGARQLGAAALRPALNPSTSGIFAADFDGDNLADLGLIGGGRLRLLLETGAIDFTGEVFGPGLGADLNSDDRIDVVTIGADGPHVWLAGDSATVRLLSAARLVGPRGDLAVIDYDGDGRLDVIASDDRTIDVLLQR